MQKTTLVRNQALKSMNGDSLVSIISTTHEVQSRNHSLLESLQTTLDLEQALSIFAQHIAPLQLCTSLRFVTDDNAFTLLNQQALEPADKEIHQHTALLYADDLSWPASIQFTPPAKYCGTTLAGQPAPPANLPVAQRHAARTSASASYS